MDINVTTDGLLAWGLKDLLGRPLGRIVEQSGGKFAIEPEGASVETMSGITGRTYSTLDEALHSIETHTHGVCRHVEASTP